MKKIVYINMFLCFFSIIIHAQVEPSVTYDPATGNYICEYEGEDSLIQVVFEPSTKITPTVNMKILRILDSNYYKYSYIVSNSASSKQRLRKICVDVFSNIYEISIPNDHWRTGFYSFVPVFRWSHNIRNDGIASPMNGIAPDSSEDGFSFKSMGLPTILNSYFVGNSTIVLAFPDEPPGEISELLHPIRKFPNNTIIKLTVGPTNPPSPFIPSEFLDTLINYTTQSFELGWITDQTTRDKYLNYFNTAKSYLEIEDTNSARNELLKVLTDVNIDSSTTLTSEAYALIKFNTEYLIERL